MTAPVAIVGVGNMGGGMAVNLLARGWPVEVVDVDADRTRIFEGFGAVARASAGLATINTIASIVCVVDATQTRDVLFGAGGIADAAPAGHTVFLCPTMAPQDTEAFAAALAQRGIDAVDAPMSGGPARARDGSMSLMVACADTVFARHAELIAALSSRVFRISQTPGDGARTKLVNNLLAGINLVGAAEVMALAQRLGLDMSRTLDVIEQSSGQSWIGSDRLRRAMAGDFEPRAHVTLLAKDTALAVAAADQAGFEGPLGARACQVFAQAISAGLAGEDDAALFKLMGGQPV
ncbi:MAG: NAD(P)-dependent oxidoreductase [Ramlibacter sp.]|nr:NAD(P)-dependent oxidoreductase [Ramlibacter sp.]